jgi:uncharacterized alkaline shock family protein YloU
MSASGLSVDRDVIRDMVRLAAIEVPGVLWVGRAGAPWRRWLRGPGVRIRTRDGRVDVRLWIVARPDQPLGPLTGQVRASVGAAIERLLGMELATVTVVVDGVGG